MQKRAVIYVGAPVSIKPLLFNLGFVHHFCMIFIAIGLKLCENTIVNINNDVYNIFVG